MKSSVFDYTESAVAIWTFESVRFFLSKIVRKRQEKRTSRKKAALLNSQLNVENCVFNFRSGLLQMPLGSVLLTGGYHKFAVCLSNVDCKVFCMNFDYIS